MKVYLITLTGQGDTDVRVVDQETWDWVTSNDPGQAHGEAGKSGWVDTLVPASQIKKQKADKYGSKVHLTSGSWQNDRMMAAYPADGYENYDALRDALKAVKAKGDEIEDTVEGDIY